jgi:hypothetical protein
MQDPRGQGNLPAQTQQGEAVACSAERPPTDYPPKHQLEDIPSTWAKADKPCKSKAYVLLYKDDSAFRNGSYPAFFV